MNTNMKELNLNEMETVNGGFDWDTFGFSTLLGGSTGAGLAFLGTLFVVSNPAGWVTGAVLAGGAIAGAVAGGGIEAICQAVTD